MEGTIHLYHPTRFLPIFLYSHPSTTPATTLLCFIGGMFDTFGRPPYLQSLASVLRHSSHYRLIHIQLSSCQRQFGTSSLSKDVSEMSTALSYIRSTPTLGNSSTKIVLMGHSTGCQDVMSYITSPPSASSPPRPNIHGAILQAAVSDRDGLNHTLANQPELRVSYDNLLQLCKSTPEAEHRATLLPLSRTKAFHGPVPMSIERFLSLASINSPVSPTEEDMFSADATPSALAKTFGAIGRADSPLQPIPINNADGEHRTLLILLSGSDEYAAARTDQDALMRTWEAAIESAGTAFLHPSSSVIPHAVHNIEGLEPQHVYAREVELAGRVLRYLDEVVEPVGGECWKAFKTGEGAVVEKYERSKRATSVKI